MTGRTTMGTSLNLGQYSIRTPEPSSELRVGAFYKRQQSTPANNENSNTASTSSMPKRKRLAIMKSTATSCQRNYQGGSITSHSTSHDSESTSASNQLVIQEPFTCSDSINNNQHSPTSDKLTSPFCKDNDASFLKRPLPPNQTPSLRIDTQSSLNTVIDSQKSHESFLIELNPGTIDSSDDETTISSIRSSEELSNFSLRTPNPPQVQKRKKIYPKQLPYNQILSGVVFVISGVENPRRCRLRDQAIEMGAKYQAKWSRSCTHLICKFKFTPKYKEVMAENGRVVREHWIRDCSKQRQLLDWRNYKIEKYPYPDSEEEVDDLD